MIEDKNDGIKIASKEEAFWTGIKEKAETEIEANHHEIVINETIIKLCKEKIAKEKKTFK